MIFHKNIIHLFFMLLSLTAASGQSADDYFKMAAEAKKNIQYEAAIELFPVRTFRTII